MVRVAFGGIFHETNTFATEALGLTQLTNFHIGRGEQILRRDGTKSYTGGMLEAARELGYDRIGLLVAGCEPSGTIADSAFEQFCTEICDRLRASLPVDAVALEMHGAGVAESYPDIEGTLVQRVREIVGKHVPIVGTFDLHGNISDVCAATFDFMCCVHEYPHTDMYERGLEAMHMVPRLLGGLCTTVHLEHIPTLLPLSIMCTHEGFPAYDMNEFMYELERRPGVLDCTVFHGFPWADIPIVGTTVIVTTDNNHELAKSIGQEAGSWIWRNRENFRLHIATDGIPRPVVVGTEAHTAQSSIRAALQFLSTASGTAQGPVVVNEASDNTGCGAPGDASHLLHAMLEADFAAGEAAFGWIYDPDALEKARSHNIGDAFPISLGGKIDPALCGKPVEGIANLRALTSGRFDSTPGAMAPGRRNLGPMALLRIRNVDVLVSANRQQTFDYGAFQLAGIDVRKCKVVGLKSATHFRAGWTSVAAKIITCEAPGWSSNNLETFEPMRKNKVARWPFDPAARHIQHAVAKL